MTRQNQRDCIRHHREALIKELENLYRKYLDLLTSLDLNERDIAKLTQIMLLSRSEAIEVLSQKIEEPLITSSPKQS